MHETIDEHKIAKAVGARIVEAREIARERGDDWTQEQIADKLGVSQPTVSAWEKGVNMPPLDRLVGLAGLLGVGLIWLITTIDPGTARGGRKGGGAP